MYYYYSHIIITVAFIKVGYLPSYLVQSLYFASEDDSRLSHACSISRPALSSSHPERAERSRLHLFDLLTSIWRYLCSLPTSSIDCIMYVCACDIHWRVFAVFSVAERCPLQMTWPPRAFLFLHAAFLRGKLVSPRFIVLME